MCFIIINNDNTNNDINNTIIIIIIIIATSAMPGYDPREAPLKHAEIVMISWLLLVAS